MTRRLLAFLPAAVALSACSYGDPEVQRVHEADYLPEPSPDIVTATIDNGATLTDIWFGEETGLYIDYVEQEGEGTWGVYVSCDTAVSGYSCLWDVYATAHSGAIAYEADLLDYEDGIGWYGAATVVLAADTGYGADGFILYTDPGVTVRFEAYLDGESAQRYVYWVGGGGVHAGAPSNPIDLRPSAN